MLAPKTQKKPTMRPFLSAIAAVCRGCRYAAARSSNDASTSLRRGSRRSALSSSFDLAGARAAADRATARWHRRPPLSPIDGMPVGIKDIIETVDMPTEMGSPLFAGWRSQKDAACVSALRQAGAVIVGKTVTTEFAASRTARDAQSVESRPHARRL